MNRSRGLVSLAVGMLVAGSVVQAAPVTWFGPSQPPNSNATWSGSTDAQNYGVAFLTGSSGPFSMGWMTIGLSTSSSATSGSGSLTVELRNATNTTPYSAVSGTTIHASDTITFTSPLTANTEFFVNLSPTDFPNISSFAMTASTGYALRLWGPSAGYGILRTTGYAENTSNDFYTVSDGFVALSTFRNNVPNYGPNPPTNTATLSIAFGVVPEPSTLTLALVGMAGGWACWRRVRRAA